MAKNQATIYVERIPVSKKALPEQRIEEFEVVRVEGTMNPLPGDTIDAARLEVLLADANNRIVIDKRRGRG